MNRRVKLASRIVALCCLATTPLLAQADDRINVRFGTTSVDRLEWQLGKAIGWNRGYQILYRSSGSGRWYTAPGAATAIGDGWVLGNDWQRGGYGIYRWNGRDWSRMPGAAIRIGGNYRSPWVINDRGIRFEWTGYDWREDRGRRDERYEDRNRDRFGDRDRNRNRDDNRSRDRDRRDRDWNRR